MEIIFTTFLFSVYINYLFEVTMPEISKTKILFQ